MRERGSPHTFDGVVVLCGRIEGIEWPVAAFGMSRAGVRLGAGHNASLVFLVLTPSHKPDFEAEVLRDLDTALEDESLRAKILAVESYTELLALLRAEAAAR